MPVEQLAVEQQVAVQLAVHDAEQIVHDDPLPLEPMELVQVVFVLQLIDDVLVEQFVVVQLVAGQQVFV